MPLIDVLLVSDQEPPPALAPALADAIAAVLGAQPGRVWVRLQQLPLRQYAENGGPVQGESPAFLTLTHARPPEGEALADEVRRLTVAAAAVLRRDPERVHLAYAPAGVGRLAFGGVLVG